MKNKSKFGYIILGFILGVVFSLLGKDNPYLEKNIRKHGDAKIYTADLNHDGVIDEKTEKNLTWKESFDVLMSQVKDRKKLKEYVKSMQIAEDEDEEIQLKLARYEILHQCEELLTISGCTVPMYTSNTAIRAKEYIKDLYCCNLNFIRFDRMYSTEKKKINVEFGANVKTLDIESANDANSLDKILHLGIGLKRYSSKPENLIQEDKNDLKKSLYLEDGLALSLKVLISDKGKESIYCFFIGKYECDKENNVPEYFKKIEVLEKEEKNQAKKIKAIAENDEEFTFTKKSDAKWEDGNLITPNDFIWSWNRMVNKKFKANYADIFYAIEGFKEYSEKTGSESYDEVEKDGTYALYNGLKGLKSFKPKDEIDEIEKQIKELEDKKNKNKNVEESKEIDKKIEELKKQKKEIETVKMPKALKKEDSNSNYFEINFEGYCSYFDHLLTSPFFYPMPRHLMTENTGKKGETIIKNWWSKNKNFSSGPFKIKSIHNVFNGTIEMVRNENYLFADEVKNDGFTFFLTSSSVRAFSKYKAGELDIISHFDTVDFGTNMETGVEKYDDDLYFCAKHKRIMAMCFYMGTYGSFQKHVDALGCNSNEDKEMVYQQIYRVFALIINRYDFSVNVERMKSEVAAGYVGECLEILPERDENGKVRAARNKDNTVKMVKWTTRDGLKIIEEKIHNKGNYSFREINTEYNRFEKRDDSSTFDSFIPVYRGSPNKDSDYTSEIKKFQKNNIKKAIQLAREVGFKYDDKKDYFTNFPSIQMLISSRSDYNDIQYRLDYFFSLFNIKIDFQQLDWNSYLSYQDYGYYEFSFFSWGADFDDPYSFLFFHQSGDSTNIIGIGKNS